jgi:hypothetical protein
MLHYSFLSILGFSLLGSFITSFSFASKLPPYFYPLSLKLLVLRVLVSGFF